MTSAQGEEVGAGSYRADITYTTHGVPHIVAEDWGSLGFGQGWACAADHLPGICDQAVKAAGRRAYFLGPGNEFEHLRSDIGYRMLGLTGRIPQFLAAQSPEALAVLTGYAAGTRAWFDASGEEDLPPWCRGAPWVRGLELEDLVVVLMDLVLMASGRTLAPMIGEAARPGDEVYGGVPAGRFDAAGPGFAKRHAVPPAPGVHLGGGLASNGWAFGGEVTGNGRGLVLANPHFPWWGEGRLWECHLKIPGEIDVYGASLVGAPGVQIGTTASLAWTHTFSRGHRFALYSHELDPSEPTRYRFGEGWEDMVGTAVSVEYRDASGGVETVSVERFATRYGPVVNLPMIGWSPGFCTSYRDANLANTGFVNQAVATARCASVNEYVATLASFGAMPWATSNIADADGNSAFLDYSVTPKLSPSAEEKFRDSVLTNPLVAMALDLRVALFDGSDPDMSWLEVDGAPWPGTTPTSDLPLSRSGRGLFNSNDPAWLCGYEERIEGTPAMSGIDRRPISPRTRANGLIVGRAWPGGADQRWSPELAVAALCERGSLMAELLLDAVTDRCAADDQLAEAVSILRSWDRQYQLGSVGATLWREFLGGFTKEELNDAGRLWAEPFDPNRPFDTPRGLCDAPSGSTGTVDPASDPVCVQMHAAIAVLASAGVAIDAPLGDVQWVQRGERRIPVPGGCEVEGIADVLGPWGAMPRADIDPRGREGVPVPSRFERTGLSEGGYPCTYGVSFLMAAGFDERGPVGLCLTAYGQSADDRSEQYWDQTVAWARGEMRPIRFHAEDVAADTIRTISVDAPRP